MKNYLSGKKTYVISVLMILIGLVKLIVGDISLLDFIMSDDIMFILGGAGLGAVRAGVTKSSPDTYIKIILILLLPSMFIGCTSSSLTFQTDQSVTVSSEPQQLAEIVDALYLGYETYEVNKGQKIDPLALTLELFPKLKEAIAGSKLALDEVTKLTDAQIITLANLGDKYNLGINKLKFKQVIKITLFLAQTYYVFSPVVNESAWLKAEAVKYF